jgi:hypothetical protein
MWTQLLQGIMVERSMQTMMQLRMMLGRMQQTLQQWVAGGQLWRPVQQQQQLVTVAVVLEGLRTAVSRRRWWRGS